MAKGQKAIPRKEWAESTRKKQLQWMQKNRVTIACNIDKETGERFKAFCAQQGKTVSAVLAEMIRGKLSESD